MRKNLVVFGVCTSVIYVLVMYCLIGGRFSFLKTMELNAIGDFLAGLFSPLAFLWLVLGFFQQGRELKISSDALHLQVEELKSSVQQQKVSVNAQLAALENYERSLEPEIFLNMRTADAGQGLIDVMDIHATGNNSSNVSVVVFDGEDKVVVELTPYLTVNKLLDIVVKDIFVIGKKYEVVISYTKSNGLSSSQSFSIFKYVDADNFRWVVKRIYANNSTAIYSAT